MGPLTLAGLIQDGAVAFSWIKPGEEVNGFRVPAGAFAYSLRSGALKGALEASGLLSDETDAVDTARFRAYFRGQPQYEACYFPVAV